MIDRSQGNACYLMPMKWRDLNGTVAVWNTATSVWQNMPQYRCSVRAFFTSFRKKTTMN
jgi:hypothetical protein